MLKGRKDPPGICWWLPDEPAAPVRAEREAGTHKSQAPDVKRQFVRGDLGRERKRV